MCLKAAVFNRQTRYQPKHYRKWRLKTYRNLPDIIEGAPMIEYFILEEKSNSLIRVPTEQPGCWIALFEPTLEELQETAQRFHIDEDDIAAPLDLEEISRIERNEDYVMFIVDTPLHDKSSGEKRYKTIPIGIFQTRDHVISVCSVYRVPLVRILKTRFEDYIPPAKHSSS